MKAFFVPTEKEAVKIFGTELNVWKYGIKKGEYNGVPVYVTGITKTLTAFSSAVIFMEERVKEVVLTGICGAYKTSGVRIGDIVSVHKDFFADEAVFYEDKADSISGFGFGLPADGCSVFEKLNIVPIVNSNTVSYLDGVGNVSSILCTKTGASVENMEGAALGYVCNIMGIKAFQIRAVSNYCGRRDDQMWDANKAFTNLKRFYETATLF